MDAQREALLNRRIEREKAARQEAERILEEKALELHRRHLELEQLNLELERRVEERTAELEAQKQAFQQLVESAEDIIYELDAGGCFRYINPAAQRVLGIAPEQWLGRHFEDLLSPDHRDWVLAEVGHWIEQQREQAYLEFAVLDASGRMRQLAQRVRIDYVDGLPVKTTAVVRDINALSAAQQELRKSEEKYRGIIENMELGLLEVDAHGRIAKAYDGFCAMTGYVVEELIGRDPIELLLHPADADSMQRQDEDRRRGKPGVYEIRIRHKNGQWIWVLISGAPIFDSDGAPNGSIGIHYDISDRKALERDLVLAKEEADKARLAEKEFLAHMSHEIRTPLNAVIGLTHLLATSALNPQQQGHAEDILNAAELLHSLISDVLDISKIEAGKVALSYEDFSLEQSLAILCRTLDFRAREKGNELTYQFEPGVPERIRADRTTLSQILFNLIGNAIKFTENGQIEVRFRVLSADRELETLLLESTIRDTGIGIEPDQLERVFERFSQAEGAHAAHQYGGTGLGLAIAKHLVELHGGSIWARSVPGKGSVFGFEIAVGRGKVEGPERRLAVAQDQNLRGLKLLLAEDNYLNRKYVKGLADRWEMDVTEAADGWQAVLASRKQRFDAILMDVQMPRMDGYEAVRTLRSEPDNPNALTPIIALTASALIDDREKAYQAGMNAHITKPFRPQALLEALMELMGSTTSVFRNTALPSWQDLALPEEFDRSALEAQFETDWGYALSMVRLFMSRLMPEFDEGQKALEDPSWAARWLHRNGPGLALIGLSAKAKMASHLESRCQTTSVENASELRAEFNAFLNEWRDLRSNLANLEAELEKRILYA